jgi:acyl-CoA reductase-like NAD-dependent aldehyde dehydrogenase
MNVTCHPIIRQILGRVHVGTRYVDAARTVIDALKHGKKTYRKMAREERREMLTQIFAQHRENREEYMAVMYPRRR